MKQKVTFEEMVAIYKHWITFDKTGLQTDVFKSQGWSCNKFFAECYKKDINV